MAGTMLPVGCNLTARWLVVISQQDGWYHGASGLYSHNKMAGIMVPVGCNLTTRWLVPLCQWAVISQQDGWYHGASGL